MPEDKTDVLLGKIVEGQKHIVAEQERQRTETTRVADAVHQGQIETTMGFGEVNASIATINQSMVGHREETDRRFGEHREDIDRAHKKIADTNKTVAESGGGSSIKRDGTIAGGSAGFVMLFDRVISFFTGSGGGPSS